MKQARMQENPNMKDYYPSQDIFLIYIINKKVFIDGQIHTLTYLKDITFGVLYEQIRAQ